MTTKRPTATIRGEFKNPDDLTFKQAIMAVAKVVGKLRESGECQLVASDTQVPRFSVTVSLTTVWDTLKAHDKAIEMVALLDDSESVVVTGLRVSK